MSNWSDTQITAKGRALDAKVTAGATTLVFTKMQLGSGIVAAENVDNMEGLDSPRMDLGISSCAVSKADNTICSVVAVASSNNVENSFLIKELGLFATDPDEGEILYAIMFDTEPDRMPNKNVASPVTLTFQVNVMSANAASIKAVIDPAGLISMATLNAVVDEHNNDKNAHGVMLGEHNADGKSHQDIRKKIAADITKHNKDEAAHSDIRQLIVDHNTNPKSHPHQLRPPLKRSTAYAKGDICFHDSLPSYAYLECITAGTTAETEQDFVGGRASDHLTDGTAVFIVRDMRCKYRTGQIVTIWGTPAEYDYLLLCDGSQISAELYPELVKVLGGNTLPDLVGRFLEGAGSAGEYKDAGLPNIKGSFHPGLYEVDSYFGRLAKGTGAIGTRSMNKTGSLLTNSSGLYGQYEMVFDASRSNPIYGSSTTLQPKSMTVKYYICYAG
ncbi:MAG: phage tail protein [Veillonellaceae bacterium]|nr:phage tail protein [Veillonellaceae bacterium]